jgi:hypothetical protein
MSLLNVSRAQAGNVMRCPHALLTHFSVVASEIQTRSVGTAELVMDLIQRLNLYDAVALSTSAVTATKRCPVSVIVLCAVRVDARYLLVLLLIGST